MGWVCSSWVFLALFCVVEKYINVIFMKFGLVDAQDVSKCVKVMLMLFVDSELWRYEIV